eukprot:TRINITY_DN10413_c0_g1_i1.p1 TRINITY_DN10413_c0_g1~~TRINITY_DN10413_c0_g1_i1.p1  ORF type:complete len:272 (+),score=63.95 TRINITY_DN10413_c0_g1_i1:3-818(+)
MIAEPKKPSFLSILKDKLSKEQLEKVIEIFREINSVDIHIVLDKLNEILPNSLYEEMINNINSNDNDSTEEELISEEEIKNEIENPKKRKKETNKEEKSSKRQINKWTDEDQILMLSLMAPVLSGEIDKVSWIKMAQVDYEGTKTGPQCAQHWRRILDPRIKKGPWSIPEEIKLNESVKKYGTKWNKVANEVGPSRPDVQCRYYYTRSKKIDSMEWSNEEIKFLSNVDPKNLIGDELYDYFEENVRSKMKIMFNCKKSAFMCYQKWLELKN